MLNQFSRSELLMGSRSETIKTKEDCSFWHRRRRRICAEALARSGVEHFA